MPSPAGSQLPVLTEGKCEDIQDQESFKLRVDEVTELDMEEKPKLLRERLMKIIEKPKN